MTWIKLPSESDCHKLPNWCATDYDSPPVIKCSDCGRIYRLRFNSYGDYWEEVYYMRASDQ